MFLSTGGGIQISADPPCPPALQADFYLHWILPDPNGEWINPLKFT